MLMRLCQFDPLGQHFLTLCNTVDGRKVWLRLACDETMTCIDLIMEGLGLSLNVRSPISSMLKVAELLLEHGSFASWLYIKARGFNPDNYLKLHEK